jgi:hypothetical protein
MFHPHIRFAAICSLVWLTASAVAEVPEWYVSTVTTDAETPLAHDVRRIMAAGYYDATADQTFISFTGANMVPHVAAYDHAAFTWGNPVSVSMHPATTDNHDYSHIFQLPDGRVGLTSSDHNAALYFAKSQGPHSIAGNWTSIEIGSGLDATYPMPMVSQSTGAISILFRQTKSPTDYRPIMRVTSTDNGDTWSSPVSAIDYGSDLRDDYMNEIYLGAMTYVADHPSATLGEGYMGTWTLAGGGGSAYGPLHDRFHKNMYYAFYQFADQSWYAADGTNLGTNITDLEAESSALVFDSGALEGRRDLSQVQDIGYTSKAVLDADGNPLVAFQNGKTNSIDIGRWDPDLAQWNVSTPATFEGTRSLRDLANINGKVWLMEDEGNGSRVVELQADGSWTDIATFSPPVNTSDNYFIDNGQPEALILAILDADGGGVYSVSTVDMPDPIIVTSDLSSVDSITGRRQVNATELGYREDSGSGLVGATGSSADLTRREDNAVFGYALPTLDPGADIVSATLYFEVTAARDHGNIDPELDVYLLDCADPSTTGAALFHNDGDDAGGDVAKVGSIYIDVGTSTTTYPDDTHEFSLTLTGEALDLLLSFYGGDHIPDQAEAFFRFNLDGYVADLGGSALNRYILDTATDETRLEIGYIPEPASVALLGIACLAMSRRRPA